MIFEYTLDQKVGLELTKLQTVQLDSTNSDNSVLQPEMLYVLQHEAHWICFHERNNENVDGIDTNKNAGQEEELITSYLALKTVNRM